MGAMGAPTPDERKEIAFEVQLAGPRDEATEDRGGEDRRDWAGEDRPDLAGEDRSDLAGEDRRDWAAVDRPDRAGVDLAEEALDQQAGEALEVERAEAPLARDQKERLDGDAGGGPEAGGETEGAGAAATGKRAGEAAGAAGELLWPGSRLWAEAAGASPLDRCEVGLEQADAAAAVGSERTDAVVGPAVLVEQLAVVSDADRPPLLPSVALKLTAPESTKPSEGPKVTG